MNIEEYKKRLQAEERRLVDSMDRSHVNALDAGDQPVGDAADESVSGEAKEEQFQDADMDWTRLTQVRDALKRIENGTFGQCVVDGGPIESKRLEAMPWTPYCFKHQKSLEAADPPHTPTL